MGPKLLSHKFHFHKPTDRDQKGYIPLFTRLRKRDAIFDMEKLSLTNGILIRVFIWVDQEKRGGNWIKTLSGLWTQINQEARKVKKTER